MDEAVINTREDLLELPGLDEEGMAQAAKDREAHIHAWHLQQLRRSRGLTQRNVAKEMQVSQPRVHEIEHGNIGKMGVDVFTAPGGELEISAHIDGNVYRMA